MREWHITHRLHTVLLRVREREGCAVLPLRVVVAVADEGGT